MSPRADALRQRAALKARARAFFADRSVLEVETPVLGQGLVVEAHIDPIPCQVNGGAHQPRDQWLLSSPEGPMKRLLAAGSGPIYQFARAFRDGEVGRRHAVEFSMLEWYRPGFDHLQLMCEVEDLVVELLPGLKEPFERVSYRQVFEKGVGIDPFATTSAELASVLTQRGVALPESFGQFSLDDALDLVLVSLLEPGLGKGTPCFVYNYPAAQAALARLHQDDRGQQVAARFELYVDGVELVNGYHELSDAGEQRRRFERANRERISRGRKPLPCDEQLLAALEQGLPDCAGVALGFDRLLMVGSGVGSIDELLS